MLILHIHIPRFLFFSYFQTQIILFQIKGIQNELAFIRKSKGVAQRKHFLCAVPVVQSVCFPLLESVIELILLIPYHGKVSSATCVPCSSWIGSCLLVELSRSHFSQLILRIISLPIEPVI